MIKMNRTILTVLICLISAAALFGQGKLYEGPDDPAGDISQERAGYMNGNRILLYYENNTQLADYPRIGTSKWPNDYRGTRMLDVVSVMIGGEIYLQNDSIPITEPDQINALSLAGEIDTLFYIQSTGFAGTNMDANYDNTVEWGFYPVPGYMNDTQDYPAMSNKPESWPLAGWPAPNQQTKWEGEWNGRFGRGVSYADLECFFVANDAQDMEYIIQRNDPEERLIAEGLRYYPRPGMHIGDVNPDVTVQKGLPWGGLGLRVGVRGFQWNNPEAKDIIFWEYNIANVSDYDLTTCGFGYFIDNSIGGDTGGDNEEGYFNALLDLSYVWEGIDLGEGGFRPGTVGIAYLESPGRPYDGVDNDDDGLLDEKRDNQAGEEIGPYDGITDLEKFLSFYHLQESDLKVHYEGDEDQDWQDGVDANGNGRYSYQDEDGLWAPEPGEHPGDDVGLDGVGPFDINYSGPDEGECNHKPDYVEGLGGEPNFAATDVSEADMVGLTSFLMFDYPEWQSLRYFLGEDEVMWKLMDSKNLNSGFIRSGGPGSIYEVFGSTTFPFYKGRTERISMGILFAYESVARLQDEGHEAPQIFRLKETAQTIYERDYRFAQPPHMPTLNATAGDGKVVLTWDDIADKRTREPFMQNVNDFEGYKLYRATDKLFSDPEVITDGQGNRMIKKPIYQCDLIDNKEGYADYGSVEGTEFYLGEDTGITHYYVDDNVQNGVTYYYAIVAYDYGIEELDLAPTENNVVLELDEAEDIVRIGQNVQIVTPHQAAAGYTAPSIECDELQTSASILPGMVVPSIADIDQVQGGHTYKVVFKSDTVDHLKTERTRHPMDMQLLTAGLDVYDISDGEKLVYTENLEDGYPGNHLAHDADLDAWVLNTGAVPFKTDIFDGLQLSVNTATDTVSLDYVNSGWITGNAPIFIEAGSESPFFAWEYEIVFTGSDTGHTIQTNVPTSIRDVDGISIGREEILLGVTLPFYILNKNDIDSLGNARKIDFVIHDLDRNGEFSWQVDRVIAGYSILSRSKWRWAGTAFVFDFNQAEDESQIPAANDVYRVLFSKPLTEVDQLVFTVKPEKELNAADVKTTMDSIKVVPNPYIATNAMETAVSNKFLNQRRRILFTHIPADCVIRIFTSSGILVDVIDVVNEPREGTVHWDLLTREGLEIAAGMYVYHVESNVTGDTKMGKFAVIK